MDPEDAFVCDLRALASGHVVCRGIWSSICALRLSRQDVGICVQGYAELFPCPQRFVLDRKRSLVYFPLEKNIDGRRR